MVERLGGAGIDPLATRKSKSLEETKYLSPKHGAGARAEDRIEDFWQPGTDALSEGHAQALK